MRFSSLKKSNYKLNSLFFIKVVELREQIMNISKRKFHTNRDHLQVLFICLLQCFSVTLDTDAFNFLIFDAANQFAFGNHRRSRQFGDWRSV